MATDGAWKLLSIKELRDRTGFSVSTLRRRVKDGTLAKFQPGGPRTRMAFHPDASIKLRRKTLNLPNSLRTPWRQAKKRPTNCRGRGPSGRRYIRVPKFGPIDQPHAE